MLERLLPPAVVAVEAYADDPGEPVFPGEEDLVATAVDGRRREFVTARRCAREALGKLGVPPVAIRTGAHREPLWPVGVVGALTHCRGYRAAAVARSADLGAIGVDAEPDEPLPDGVLRLLLGPGDDAMLARLGGVPVHADRLLFSAKESVYKAWFPLTGRWLGFEDASLTVDPAAGTFTAAIHVDGARADGGPALRRLRGRFAYAGGLIVTAVVVDR